MPEQRALPLKMVDGLTLSQDYRTVLRPGELVTDDRGLTRRLPRFFYEVASWQHAHDIMLAPSFGLYEFINTDVREAKVLRGFPRYVPCAVTLLAAHLAVLRAEVGTFVHVAANGGYRSPAHARSRGASVHHWGTAVDIYRIGDDYMDGREMIERYADLVREILPTVWVRPYGHGSGFVDDHLHLDLGFVVQVPHEAAGVNVHMPETM